MPINIDFNSPDYELQRLLALGDYLILDTPQDATFDEIAEVASLICDVPVALISFVDRERQWFKSEKGLGICETPRNMSICAHAILQPGMFIIPDLTQDSRFANNPLVTGEPHLRFYAGALLKSHDGYPLGTLCVLDYQPRELNESQRFALQALATQVMAHMELMKAHREQAELIRELEATRQELTKHAATDSLTGLLNRRAFEQRFDQELALIKRGAPPASLMLIDLDHFKTANDTLGHQAGDELLVRFTAMCREVFRQADVISRWGGDEFVVMLPSSSVAEAALAAERLHQRLAETSMRNDGSPPLTITVSIGACALTGNSTLDECLHRADDLLYLAKEQGRNRTVSEA